MTPLIVGNWKMNGLMRDARDLTAQLVEFTTNTASNCEIVLCPPFPYLNLVNNHLVGSSITLGAQDCHHQSSGAFTGDTSASMLADVGCKYVIVGHSERRQGHGESNSMVKPKASAAHASDLTPIICIGENLAERNAGKTIEVLTSQLENSIPEGATFENTVIAYEPVWAIGTGNTAEPKDLETVYQSLRELLTKLIAGGESARILYGGSVKPSNASQILQIKNIGGLLVGGASLIADDFWAIAQQNNKAA